MRPVKDELLDIGKMPPQALELEEAVLGALILEPDAIVNIGNVLRPEMMYKDVNQKIYKAISLMNDNSEKIDMLTVVEKLRKLEILADVGGAFYISQLTNQVASSTHIEAHASVIKEMFIKRELINISALVQQKAYTNSIDSEDILSYFNKKIESIYTYDNGGVVKLSNAINEVCDDIKENQGEGKKIEGFSTDLKSLREYVNYWENGRLIVIAARPGMGKTALAIHEALNVTKQFKNALYFSLEMSYKQLTKRVMLTSDSIKRYMFDVNDIKDSQWEQLDNGITEVYDYNLFIDDNTFNLNSIKNKCKIMKKKHSIDAVFIDYLQLIEGDKGLQREQQVAQMSRSFKLIAKELQIPVFLLAQLNRESEQRKSEGYLPKMSDLRESGAIEQDADIIVFPHRACYYEPDDERVWLIVAKNRDGETGKAEVRTNKSVTKFYDPYDNSDKIHPSNFEITMFDDDEPF